MYSLVFRPLPLLPSVCNHNNIQMWKSSEKQGRPGRQTDRRTGRQTTTTDGQRWQQQQTDMTTITLPLVHVHGVVICYKVDPSHDKIFSLLIHSGSVKTLQPRMQEKEFFLECQLSKRQLPKYQLPKMLTPNMSSPKIANLQISI